MKSDVSMSANEPRARSPIAAILLILAAVISTGCAHNNPRDPLEPLNRRVYIFNDTVDKMVLKPVATGYRAVVPEIVRTGVRNFFSNLDDITVIANGILQLKFPQAASDTGRFVINTTLGLLGLVDVATHLGLEKHNEDFGQTLGYWGVGSGPFLVIPLLGPSTVRDGIGRLADVYTTDLVWHVDYIRARNIALGTRVVSNREQLLDSEKILDTAALDRYSFIRDAYLQRRRNLVYDGNPPPEPEEEFMDEEPSSKEPRSLMLEPSPSVLTDSFGNLVAGPLPDAGPAGSSGPEGEPFGASRPEPAAAPAAPAASTPVPSPSRQETDAQAPTPGRAVPDVGASLTVPRATSILDAPLASSQKLVRVWLQRASGR